MLFPSISSFNGNAYFVGSRAQSHRQKTNRIKSKMGSWKSIPSDKENRGSTITAHHIQWVAKSVIQWFRGELWLRG